MIRSEGVGGRGGGYGRVGLHARVEVHVDGARGDPAGAVEGEHTANEGRVAGAVEALEHEGIASAQERLAAAAGASVRRDDGPGQDWRVWRTYHRSVRECNRIWPR